MSYRTGRALQDVSGTTLQDAALRLLQGFDRGTRGNEENEGYEAMRITKAMRI